jgi:hypothetical protein
LLSNQETETNIRSSRPEEEKKKKKKKTSIVEDKSQQLNTMQKKGERKTRLTRIQVFIEADFSFLLPKIFQLRGDEPLDDGIATSVVCPPLSLGELCNQKVVKNGKRL